MDLITITPELLHFNGVGKDAHEDVFIGIKEEKQSYSDKTDPMVFGFCKTAQKPYDKYVTAVLILAKYHFGSDFVISSDGDAIDWHEGRDIVNDLFGYRCDFKIVSGIRMKINEVIFFVK